jgi:Ulp1 family protease
VIDLCFILWKVAQLVPSVPSPFLNRPNCHETSRNSRTTTTKQKQNHYWQLRNLQQYQRTLTFIMNQTLSLACNKYKEHSDKIINNIEDSRGNVEYFTFDSATLRERDLLRLESERMLNDELVNFMARRLFAFHGAGDHFAVPFSTYFFSKQKETLHLILNKSLKCDITAAIPHVFDFNNTKTKPYREYMFRNVQKWGKDIFNHQFCLIPIHMNTHWSLVMLKLETTSDNPPIATFYHFNSLVSSHSKSIIHPTLSSYLNFQWELTKNGKQPTVAPSITSVNETSKDDEVQVVGKSSDGVNDVDLYPDMQDWFGKSTFVSIKVAQQKGTTACGVFMLKFMEILLQNSHQLQIGLDERLLIKLFENVDIAAECEAGILFRQRIALFARKEMLEKPQNNAEFDV